MPDCPTHVSNLKLLLDHTDICTSVLVCRPDVIAALKRRAQGCNVPSQKTVRRVQSNFGAIRRMYAPLLQQHPSVPLELRTLLSAPDRVQLADTNALEIVLTRCREPLWPILRVLPAAIPLSARVRARVLVYERCSPGLHLHEHPRLDVRERVPPVRRVAFHVGGGSGGGSDGGGSGGSGGGSGGDGDTAISEASATASAFGAHLVAAERAARVLFLLPAGVAALSSAPSAAPFSAFDLSGPRSATQRAGARATSKAPLSAGGQDVAVRNQRAMQRELRTHWSTIASPVEKWTRADGAAAALSACVVRALDQSYGSLVLEHANGDAMALLLSRTAHTAAAGSSSSLSGNGTSEWFRLMQSAPRFRCAPRRTPVGKQCSGDEANRASSRQPSGGGGGVGGSGWPGNVSLTGFCGVTNEGVEGSCENGDSGSWNTRMHRVRSFADCAGRCALCARCSYVTYSPENDDCSWYSHKACNLRRLGHDEAFQTVMAMPSPRGKRNQAGGGGAGGGGAGGGGAGADAGAGGGAGGAGARTRARGVVAGDARVRSAHVDYLCSLRADRKWGRELLRGAMLLLVNEAQSERAEGDEPAEAMRQRGGGLTAAVQLAPTHDISARGTPLVHPACVAADFMLHNRQLLPLPASSAASADPCIRAAALPVRQPQQSQQSQQSQSQQPSLQPSQAPSRLLSHSEASAELSALIRSIGIATSSAGCPSERSARMELHLSGFFSM